MGRHRSVCQCPVGRGPLFASDQLSVSVTVFNPGCTCVCLQGDFRLSEMPNTIHARGHRYVLQIDDDSFVLSPAGEGFVQIPHVLYGTSVLHAHLCGGMRLPKTRIVLTWRLPLKMQAVEA